MEHDVIFNLAIASVSITLLVAGFIAILTLHAWASNRKAFRKMYGEQSNVPTWTGINGNRYTYNLKNGRVIPAK